MGIAILAAAVMAMAGYHLGKGRVRVVRVGPQPKIVSGRAMPGPGRPTQPGRAQPRPSHLATFVRVVNTGFRPTSALAELAYGEACMLGDREMAEVILAFACGEQSDGAGAVVMGAETPPGSVAPEEPSGEPSGEIPSQIGPPPIEGVEADGWSSFVSALATRDPGFVSDNHLGRFEHNRRRLRQLEIPEESMATPLGQYQALCRDMAEYHKGCRKVIDDYTGDVVEIEGVNHPVTLSGVLGLLKAAGPKGAERWLNNPADRKTFPGTTSVFVRTNGCF